MRELKAGRYEPPAVVFLTEVEDGDIRELCLAEGARRFLLKKDGWPAIVAEIHGVIAELDPLSEGIMLLEGPRPEARIFKGNLETIEILDIIQLLNLGKKTGILLLSGSVLDGRIGFEDGEIVHAQNHDESGVAATRVAAGAQTRVLPLRGRAPHRRAHDPPVHVDPAPRRPALAGRGRAPHSPRRARQRGRGRVLRLRAPSPGASPPATGSTPGSPMGRTSSRHSRCPPMIARARRTTRSMGGALGHSPFGSVPMWPADRELPEALRPAPPPAPESPFLPEPPAYQAFAPPPSRPASFGAGEAGEPAHADAYSSPEAAPGPVPIPSSPHGWSPASARRDSKAAAACAARARSVALAGGATVALLASGYVLFFSNLVHDPAEAMENADYRSLMLEAAANQTKIDSLEQVVGGLTQSVQNGDVAPADAQQRISAIQTEIQRASTNLDVARKAADAKLEEDQRRDAEEEAGDLLAARKRARSGRSLRGGGPAPARARLRAGRAPTRDGDSRPVGERAARRLRRGAPEHLRPRLRPARARDGGHCQRERGGPSGARDALSPLAKTTWRPEERPQRARLQSPQTTAWPPFAALPPSCRSMPAPPHALPCVPSTLLPSPSGGIGGTVTLWVLVDASGQVEDVRALRSSGQPELDRAAMDAIRRSRYSPARRAGAAVPSWTQQQIVFKLD